VGAVCVSHVICDQLYETTLTVNKLFCSLFYMYMVNLYTVYIYLFPHEHMLTLPAHKMLFTDELQGVLNVVLFESET